MSYAETTTTVASLTNGQLVRAFVGHDGHGKVFLNGSEAAGGSASSANLPAVNTVTATTQADTGTPWYSQSTDTGMVTVTLTVPAGDLIDGNSVQTFKIEGGAVVVVATG